MSAGIQVFKRLEDLLEIAGCNAGPVIPYGEHPAVLLFLRRNFDQWSGSAPVGQRIAQQVLEYFHQAVGVTSDARKIAIVYLRAGIAQFLF